MRIGTTPTHTFNIPSAVVGVATKVRVIYAQCGKKVLSKDVDQLTGGAVVVKLTQEETLKFHNRKPVDIQIRVLTQDGTSLTSDIVTRTPYECLENEVFA